MESGKAIEWKVGTSNDSLFSFANAYARRYYIKMNVVDEK